MSETNGHGRTTPDVVETMTAQVAGWCTEDEVEAAKEAAADTLLEQLGTRILTVVTFTVYDVEGAQPVLDELVTGAIDDDESFNYYRRIRGCLREHGGLLVVASAEASVR